MTFFSIIKKGYRFSTQKDSAFDLFMRSNKQQLLVKRNPGRNSLGTEIHVPYKSVDKQKIINFFEEREIIDKNIMINVDCSHLLGMKRLVMSEYLEQNIYKGQGQPMDILMKQNPSQYVEVDELIFDQTVFAITDPIFLQKSKSLKIKMQNLLPQITQYYNDHPSRGIQRLFSQYKLPKEYLDIVQIANNMQNKIYFIGLNEYELRLILSSYLKLQDVKILFMESMKYAGQGNQPEFHHKAKEYLWKKYYSFLQPISYQMIANVRQEIRGYCFGHSYQFIRPENPSIEFRDLKDKDPDSSKLQKHAIFQVLYGNIWSQPYTKNPFPYLTQRFINLSKEDQNLVADCYNSFYVNYKNAKNRFFSK